MKIKLEVKKSEYWIFGKKYLGPFLYSYISWLYENLVEENIHKVFFLARDGYLMEKAFSLLTRYKNVEFDSKYVYFSRNSLRKTMLWRCNSYRESLKYLSSSRFISMSGLLEYWGFSQFECQEISRQFNINLLDELLVSGLPGNAGIESIYLKLEEIIKRKSKQQDILLQRYVKQIGMSGDCAIVDIGWHGRMQQYIENYFEDHNILLRCKGYYLGIQEEVPLKGTTKGFLYDTTHLKLRKSTLVFLGGYEKLFQSSEGSTFGYSESDGTILPIFSAYEYENQDTIQCNIQDWRDGALNYVQSSLENDLCADFTLAKPLIHIGQYPTLKFVKMFSFFCNDDGNKEYFVSQKSLLHYSFKQLIYDLSNSCWKSGFMKSIFKIPFPYYFIYCMMRK